MMQADVIAESSQNRRCSKNEYIPNHAQVVVGKKDNGRNNAHKTEHQEGHGSGDFSGILLLAYICQFILPARCVFG
jgi:hypothetical protein